MIRREPSSPRSIAVRTASFVLCPVLVLSSSGAPALADQQPRPGGVIRVGEQVDVSGLHGVNVSDIAPGYRESWLVTVANERSESVTLGVRVDGLADDDNGCNDPESRVDDSCDGRGELGDHLELHLGVPDNVRMFSASLNEATSGSGQVVTVPARGEAEVVLGLTLPAATGNEVQTDSVEFVLVWRAEAVPGASPDSSEDGVELRSTVVGGGDSANLALTGARVMLLVGLAMALVAGGTLLFLVVGREREKRPTDRAADR
ncbi:hypothetical protein NI17_018980 [Thermobifida halotolerans]|uniref:Uncharacterized protein n=1 Tax=Thermobifida halotolerans TaxID=483545 RepID=A0A399FV76_9ACTN|nr:hypothetical protein NI17_018980 [Thermobifida halotolerans]